MMTKEEFLARCANAYDAGLITPPRMQLMARWLDVVMREGYSRVVDILGDQGDTRYIRADQWDHVRTFWHGWGGEMQRLLKDTDKETAFTNTLANDSDGYKLIQFAAILTHPCQLCATDPNAWWTRAGFCPHRALAAEPAPDTEEEGD